MIAGVTHCRVLPTTAEHDWALAPETLEAAVQEDLQVSERCCANQQGQNFQRETQLRSTTGR